MGKLNHLKPERVFHYFEEISAIPRGSGNRKGISSYCMEFAAAHGLRALCDDADNVVIFKNASTGYEDAEPVILQGHLDMVCQKTEDSPIDFEKDGLKLYVDGDFVKADGTTLGADNGIAVAMVLAILEDDTLSHPPIEAVFTSDEEIGMIGAMQFCMDNLKGKRMMNLDAEDPTTLTVSCAGGSDFKMTIPLKREIIRGKRVVLRIKGLKGGHSGMEINTGRVNANMLAGRILHYAQKISDYKLISIDGGDKGNAIPFSCIAQLVVQEPEPFAAQIKEYLEVIKQEIADREEGFSPTVEVMEEDDFAVMDAHAQEKVMFTLLSAPNGVVDMSVTIKNLVETSLNLGILKTEEEDVLIYFSLRSNKRSAMAFLEERLLQLATHLDCKAETFGHYPPWEFREDSELQKLYQETYLEQYGSEPKVVAIHAGLECGVFASQIEGLDCIAIGPETLAVHTVEERLSVSSTAATYELILKLLGKCH
ncbi:MAG: aminoacyl-histidine dipeptidase [Clostridia bacterium]|nr:aminoacyl-histidine dipeptidase [Clostridia bacterium]